jgi:hypothetical protein
MYESIRQYVASGDKLVIDRSSRSKTIVDNLPVPYGFGDETITEPAPKIERKKKIVVDWSTANNIIPVSTIAHNEGVFDMKPGEVRWYSYENGTERERLQSKIIKAIKIDGLTFAKRGFRGLFYVERI